MNILAYLDAGTGSVLLQALVGGVAAVGVGARLYWQRMKARVTRSSKREPSDPQQP